LSCCHQRHTVISIYNVTLTVHSVAVQYFCRGPPAITSGCVAIHFFFGTLRFDHKQGRERKKKEGKRGRGETFFFSFHIVPVHACTLIIRNRRKNGRQNKQFRSFISDPYASWPLESCYFPVKACHGPLRVCSSFFPRPHVCTQFVGKAVGGSIYVVD